MSPTLFADPDDEVPGLWQFVLLPVSILAMLGALVQLMHKVPTESLRLLGAFDYVVCTIFLADFLKRLARTKDRGKFWRRNWPDAIACVPADLFMLARVAWVVRIVIFFRLLRSVESVLAMIRHSRARTTVAALAISLFVVVAVASVTILSFEDVEGANIKTAGDAIWWAMATVTTVGYGDRYPITTGGRVLAVLLMMSGVAVFSSLAGIMAAWFAQPPTLTEECAAEAVPAQDLRALRDEIAQLRAELRTSLSRE